MTDRAAAHPADARWVGRRIEVEVGPIAHGGHCVARHDGRVVFVRHALPGELVVVEITEDGGKNFCRGDAVQILSAAPARVTPPCPYAHPGGCGGCDFQHVRPPDQRALKAAVVAEQFRRLAGVDVSPEVEPLRPDDLGWRRRVRYAVSADGKLGLHAHRSGRIVEIDRCLIGAPGVGDNEALTHRWPPAAEVEIATDDAAATAVVLRQPEPPAARPRRRGRDRRRSPSSDAIVVSGPDSLRFDAGGRRFTASATGFWQTHPAAADAYLAAVVEGIAPRPGEHVLDLYAGAGLFTAVFAEAVTASGRVLAVEGDPAACADARRNLADLGWAQVQHAHVGPAGIAAAAAELEGVDVVLLDPPRTGAGAAVIEALTAVAPRVFGYVACDPAALARDVATALALGWRLDSLRAFDAFPMTHHVECVAVLAPSAG